MKSLRLWLTELIPQVPGATEELLLQQLCATIREFSVQSGAWVETLSPIDIKADKASYWLNPQPNGNVVFVTGVEVSGDAYTPVQDGPGFPATSRNRVFWSEKPGYVTISPAPTEDIENGLVITAALAPKPGLAYAPDDYYELWFDHIMDGALGRLFAMQKKAWSNSQLAVPHIKRFRAGMAQARDVVRRRYVPAESEWFYPGWA